MRFRLTYKGRLKGQAKDKDHVHKIREVFHSQISMLWNQDPLRDYDLFLKDDHVAGGIAHHIDTVSNFAFASIIHPSSFLIAHLNILFLRPSPPGALFRDGGDIDNRLKTLIDALRVPKSNEIPSNWEPLDNQKPFHCLLHDDKLVSNFAVETDRLLVENCHEQQVFLVVHVTVQASRVTFDNAGLIG